MGLDLSAVVANAVEGLTDDGGSDVEVVGTPEDTDTSMVVPDGDVADTSTKTDDTPKPKEVVVDPDDLTAEEWAELGIHPPIDGERPNRIPQPRVKVMIGKALKKRAEAHRKELDDHKTKLTAAERRLSAQAEMDTLLATDDRKYLHLLAALHPDKYDKYLTPAEKKAVVEEKKADVVEDPMPQPDQKATDGTLGYSVEQWDKFTQWQGRGIERKVRADVEADMQKKYGDRLKPILDRHEKEEAEAAYAAKEMPKIKADVDAAIETWGDLFTEEYKKGGDSDIVKYLIAHPGLSFAAGVSAILKPKLTTTKTKMRSEVIEELKGRPAGADRSAPGQAKPEEVDDANLTTRQVVAREVAKLKR